MDRLDLLAVQESSPTPQFESINSLVLSFLYTLTLSSILSTGKTIALTRWTFVGKVMSLLFNMLSRLAITFLPRSKNLLISAITIYSEFGAPQNKVCHCFHCFPILDVMILVFWMLSFKPTFSLSSFNFIKRLFSSSLSAIMGVSSAYLRLLIFLLASWFQFVLPLVKHFSWCILNIS